jgi:hypothetical protein
MLCRYPNTTAMMFTILLWINVRISGGTDECLGSIQGLQYDGFVEHDLLGAQLQHPFQRMHSKGGMFCGELHEQHATAACI